MIYISDYKNVPSYNDAPSCNSPIESAFSVILNNNKNPQNASQYSVSNTLKPLVYISSAFGSMSINYVNGSVRKTRFRHKIYSMLLTSLYFWYTLPLVQRTWTLNKTDLPLQVLTMAYTTFHYMELVIKSFVVSFIHDNRFVKLFETLDNLDKHFGMSKEMYKRRLFSTIIIIATPVLQLFLTFYQVKYNFISLIVQMSFFSVLIQAALSLHVLIQILVMHAMLNYIVMQKVKPFALPKNLLFKRLSQSFFVVNLLIDIKTLQRNIKRQYCWFELMQIYDKIADCVYIFNNIYAGSLFLMYTAWLLQTLLLICRCLSPTIKVSDHIFRDLVQYFSINLWPIYVALLCDALEKGRLKTLNLLIHNLVHGKDEHYIGQVYTMIDLVETRRLEISTHTFTADISTVLVFCGKVVSYAVLMIEYFYMYAIKT